MKKRPDGTPFTPAEWNAEHTRRWEWLGQQQRSSHPISDKSLPLFQGYADGELSLEEVREGLHRLYNRRRFPEGPDGPEVPLPPPAPAPAATGEPVVGEGAVEEVVVMLPTPPRLSREEQDRMIQQWIERSRRENPDKPWIGRWITFTTSEYPKADEDEHGLN